MTNMPHPENSGSFEAGYQQGYPSIQQSFTPAPPLAPGTFECLRSLEQAWRIFKEKPLSWILPSLVYFGVGIVFYLVGYIQFLIAMTRASDPETGEIEGNFPWTSLTVMIVCVSVFMVCVCLWGFIATREAVYAVGGKRPEFRDLFTFRRVGIMLVLSLLIMLLQIVGLLAFIVGVLVVSFFLLFALPAIVFEGVGFGDALKSSCKVVKENPGQTLLLYLLVAILCGVGSSTFLGIVITQPLCQLAIAHAYMTATGRPVEERLQ